MWLASIAETLKPSRLRPGKASAEIMRRHPPRAFMAVLYLLLISLITVLVIITTAASAATKRAQIIPQAHVSEEGAVTPFLQIRERRTETRIRDGNSPPESDG
jgi:hypothetical protein